MEGWVASCETSKTLSTTLFLFEDFRIQDIFFDFDCFTMNCLRLFIVCSLTGWNVLTGLSALKILDFESSSFTIGKEALEDQRLSIGWSSILFDLIKTTIDLDLATSFVDLFELYFFLKSEILYSCFFKIKSKSQC